MRISKIVVGVSGALVAPVVARVVGVTAIAAWVVAVMLRNEIAFLEAMLIARQAGCYSCPINFHYKADEAGYILRDVGARALIVHADLLRQIDGGVPSGVQVIVVSRRDSLSARPPTRAT